MPRNQKGPSNFRRINHMTQRLEISQSMWEFWISMPITIKAKRPRKSLTRKTDTVTISKWWLIDSKNSTMNGPDSTAYISRKWTNNEPRCTKNTTNYKRPRKTSTLNGTMTFWRRKQKLGKGRKRLQKIRSMPRIRSKAIYRQYKPSLSMRLRLRTRTRTRTRLVNKLTPTPVQ